MSVVYFDPLNWPFSDFFILLNFLHLTSEKEHFYQELKSLIKNIPKKGPFLLLGDWNAKPQEADTEDEEQWIGGKTFDKGFHCYEHPPML